MKKLAKLLVTVIFCLGVAFAAVIPAFAAAKQVKNVKKAVTASTVTLTWNKASGAKGYAVQQYNGKKWKTIASTAKTKHTVKKLKTGTTYKFRIRSYSGSGKNLKYAKASAVVSAKPVCAAPKTVTASSVSPTSVKLSWSKLSSATGYLVQKYNTATESWEKAATTKSTSITVSGLKTGVAVKFRVRGYTKVGKKTVYGLAKAVTATPVLSAPTGVKIAATSPTTAKLSWNAVSGAKGYAVQKYNASTKKWAHVDYASALTYTAKNLIPTADNRLRVIAYVVQGGKYAYSKASAAVSVKPTIAKATGLSHGESDSNSVFLSWNSVNGVDGYNIYSRSGKKLTLLTSSSASSCTVTGLKSNTEYTFVVKPFVKASDSKTYFGADSNAVTWKTAPAPVTNPTEKRATDNSILLSWEASADAADIESYEVFVLVTEKDASGIESDKWVSIGETKNTELTKNSINGVPFEQQTPYEFKIYAYSVYYYEDKGTQRPAKLYSTPALLSASTALSRIKNLTVDTPTATTLNVSWTVNAKAESYKLEMSKDAKEWTEVDLSKCTLVSSTDVSKLIYTVSGLEAATKYYFRVSGGKGGAFSEACEAKDGTTTPAAIADLKAENPKSTTVTLTWKAVAGAAKYELWYLDGSKKDAAWTKLDENSKDVTLKVTAKNGVYTAVVSKLSQLTEYQFKVNSYAKDQSTPSDFSNIEKVTTPLQGVVLEVQTKSCTSDSIYIGWVKNAKATSYILEASKNNKDWKVVKNDLKNTNDSHVVYIFKDKDLAPLSTVYFRATAVNGDIKSEVSAVLEAKTAPAAVENLSTLSSTDKSITIGFKKVDGVDGYIVKYKKSGSSSSSSLNSTSLTGKSHFTIGKDSVSVKIDGLSELTEYQISVSAYKTVSSKEPLTSVEVDHNETTVLSAVKNFKCIDPTETSITLTWSANSKADGYILEMSNTGSSGWTDTKAKITASKDGKTYTAVVDGLTSSDIKYFRVKATKGRVEGMASTAEGRTKPAKATVTVKEVTATSVTLDFTGTSVADKHYVRYSTDGGKSWKVATATPTTGMSYVVNGLSAGTDYIFEVTAINGNTSAEPTTVNATTLLAAVTNVRVTGKNDTHVTIVWKTNGADSYIVKGGAKEATSTTGSAEVEVVPGTAYTFNVIPVKDKKEGTAALATYTTAPVAVTLTGTLADDNKLTLRWDTTVNGKATIYDVYKVGSDTPIAANVTGGQHEVTVNQAKAYDYYVVARTTAEDGKPSNHVTGTGNLLPVTSATIKFENGKAILTVTGNLPNGASFIVLKGEIPIGDYQKETMTVELKGVTEADVDSLTVVVALGKTSSRSVIVTKAA